jgi:hypothetical protein
MRECCCRNRFDPLNPYQLYLVVCIALTIGFVWLVRRTYFFLRNR